MGNLKGQTLFITGASRGIGKAIALKAARDGANIVVAAKTSEPDPRLPGTIHTAAAEIEAAGGRALPLVVDVRDEENVRRAVAQAAEHFGGIDILVNNASAINLNKAADVPAKRYDLMMDINVRGTFMCSQACLPYLEKAANPHILVLSPPLNIQPKWFESHAAYTVSKFSMSLMAYGLAAELRSKGIAVNALWPQTIISTAALNIAGSALGTLGRKPEIMADAAYVILTRGSREATGQFYIDEAVLREAGVSDFAPYLTTPGTEPMLDLYIDA
ncbi:MAG: NAD(P)-dependent oxidoreductase [Burkholderiales bacterium]|nr:NAD(P)-dependent oxidoreductase [Burkholderiales bacterium]MDE2076338.1 NAD(P)-dependent oxidoreductase [Burkholderiales bacterium]MDE2433269.1 NAD(P)-dependent oxidoreductase [Burkholderiales bacterium]